jgi:hypothetical protein
MPFPRKAPAAGYSDHREFDNRRRSQRIMLPVRVLVYRWGADDCPFKDIVYTQSVNVHGGLIALTATLQPGELFLLVNTFTDEERQCHVVHVGSKHGAKRDIGFELIVPESWFWSFDSFPIGALGVLLD